MPDTKRRDPDPMEGDIRMFHGYPPPELNYPLDQWTQLPRPIREKLAKDAATIKGREIGLMLNARSHSQEPATEEEVNDLEARRKALKLSVAQASGSHAQIQDIADSEPPETEPQSDVEALQKMQDQIKHHHGVNDDMTGAFFGGVKDFLRPAAPYAAGAAKIIDYLPGAVRSGIASVAGVPIDKEKLHRALHGDDFFETSSEMMKDAGVGDLGHLADIVPEGMINRDGWADLTGRGVLGFGADVVTDPFAWGSKEIGKQALQRAGARSLNEQGVKSAMKDVADQTLAQKWGRRAAWAMYPSGVVGEMGEKMRARGLAPIIEQLPEGAQRAALDTFEDWGIKGTPRQIYKKSLNALQILGSEQKRILTRAAANGAHVDAKDLFVDLKDYLGELVKEGTIDKATSQKWWDHYTKAAFERGSAPNDLGAIIPGASGYGPFVPVDVANKWKTKIGTSVPSGVWEGNKLPAIAHDIQQKAYFSISDGIERALEGFKDAGGDLATQIKKINKDMYVFIQSQDPMRTLSNKHIRLNLGLADTAMGGLAAAAALKGHSTIAGLLGIGAAANQARKSITARTTVGSLMREYAEHPGVSSLGDSIWRRDLISGAKGLKDGEQD